MTWGGSVCSVVYMTTNTSTHVPFDPRATCDEWCKPGQCSHAARATKDSPPITHKQAADGPIVRTAGGQEIHPEDHDYAAAVTVMGYAKGMARATGSRGAYYMADGVYAQWSRA